MLKGLAFIYIACTAALSSAQNTVYTYDPSLGTLPDSQGWRPFVQAGDITVAGGVLELDTTAGPALYHYFEPFDSVTNRRWANGVDFEMSIQVISSEFALNGQNQPRFGFYPISYSDPDSHFFSLALGKDRVALISHVNGTRLEHMMDTTDGVHTYRLCTDENGGRLFVDGRYCGTVPYENGVALNINLWWADGSSGASSHTRLSSFRLVFEPGEGTCPDPCSLVDLNFDGLLDNGDIVLFITLFLEGDLSADMNNDGLLDNGDIGSFIPLFLAGCP